MNTPGVLYGLVFGVLLVILVWRDAARAQRLLELYQRTRDGLVAFSLLGTVLSGAGIAAMLVGALLATTAPAAHLVSPGAARALAVGGAFLIVGWIIRVAAWMMWKRHRR